MSNLSIEIVIRDDLSQTQMVFFEGLHIAKAENNWTRLFGQIPDDSALYGLLERLRDLNLHLVSVQVNPILPKGVTK